MIFVYPIPHALGSLSSHTCGLVVRLARRKNHGLCTAAAIVPKGITGGIRLEFGPGGQVQGPLVNRRADLFGDFAQSGRRRPTPLYFHFTDLNDGLDVCVVGDIRHDFRRVGAERGLECVHGIE
jgi:hypothetical protein